MAENFQDSVNATKTIPPAIVPRDNHPGVTTHESIAAREIAAGTEVLAHRPADSAVITPHSEGAMEAMDSAAAPTVAPHPGLTPVVHPASGGRH